MSASRSLSRRSAVAGLGAGSLGAILAARALAAPTVENGSSGDSSDPVATLPQRDPGESGGSLANHPLVGLWLSQVEIPSNPGATIAVPTLFGSDGSVILFYPATEVAAHGVQVKGAAVGTWEPTGARSAHYTAVQALSDIDGGYLGSVTLDGYPIVGADGESYAVNAALERVIVRNAQNLVTSRLSGAIAGTMHGAKMHPGFDGFPQDDDEDLPPYPTGDPREPF